MTPNGCEFLTRFIANPESVHEEDRARADELFKHFAECPDCQARIDQIGDDNAAILFDILARAETISANPDEDRRLDAILEADSKREQSIREAVQDNLISGFLRFSAAGSIAKNFDPLILHSATEAVSMLVRRYRSLSHPRGFLELNPDGSLRSNEREAISAGEMATEIARFANLWETSEAANAGESGSPIEQGQQLAEWTFLAAHERPNLLRDFRAVSSILPGTAPLGLRMLRYMPTGIVKPQVPLQLIPLNPSDRIDDLNKRWRPLTTDLPFVYGVPKRRQVESRTIPVLQFTTKEFFNVCSSYHASAQTSEGKGSYSEMTFFLLDKELSVVQPQGGKATEVIVDSGYKAACTMIGTFKNVFFEGKGEIELVDIAGKRTTKYAPRLDVPIHMKDF